MDSEEEERGILVNGEVNLRNEQSFVEFLIRAPYFQEPTVYLATFWPGVISLTGVGRLSSPHFLPLVAYLKKHVHSHRLFRMKQMRKEITSRYKIKFVSLLARYMRINLFLLE